MAALQALEDEAEALGLSLRDRSFFVALDGQDEFAHLRARFHIPKAKAGSCRDDAVYLCGNSLGAMPRQAKAYVNAELDQWATLGVGGHFEEPRPWVSVDEAVQAASARLVGAEASEVATMNSLTVNLHLMLAAFYKPDVGRGKVKILVEGQAFPSDVHMLQSQVRWHGLDPDTALVTLQPRAGEATLRTADIVNVLEQRQAELALVLLSGVQYYTGQLFEIGPITAAARALGIVVGWDLAHAVGNVPLQLHADGPDFACWCTYKYLNSGPGNVAGCFVHERHGGHASLASFNRLAGWWGHRASDRFAMASTFVPAPGAEGFRCSNPPVLCVAALRASLEVFDEAGGVGALRRKALRLTALLEALLDRLPEGAPRLAGAVAVFTPRDPAQRGCQLSLSLAAVPGGVEAVFQKLDAAGVVCDVRKPAVMRVAPTPLYNTYADVFDFVALLKEALLEVFNDAAAAAAVAAEEEEEEEEVAAAVGGSAEAAPVGQCAQ